MSVIDCVSSILCWEFAMLCPPTGKFRRIQGKRKQARSAVTKDTTLHSINEPVVLEHCCGQRILYTLRTHAQAHANTRLCVTSWFHGYYEKNHQVQFCCNRSCERYRLEGTRATRCDIVKQFEDFEADLNNRSQEIAHVSVLSLLSSSIFHPWDTGFIWLLCRPKVSKGGFTSRVVGFHQVHLRHTLGHHTYTNCQSTDWSSSLFVSFPPIAYLSYFHLWRWDKGWN